MSVHNNSINVNDVNESLKTVSSGRDQHVLQVLPDRHPATVAKSQSKVLVIGTWNVRTLMEIGKLDNIKREMGKMNVNILGLCETRLVGAGDMYSDDYRMIYSGGNKDKRVWV